MCSVRQSHIVIYYVEIIHFIDLSKKKSMAVFCPRELLMYKLWPAGNLNLRPLL